MKPLLFLAAASIISSAAMSQVNQRPMPVNERPQTARPPIDPVYKNTEQPVYREKPQQEKNYDKPQTETPARNYEDEKNYKEQMNCRICKKCGCKDPQPLNTSTDCLKGCKHVWRKTAC